MNKLTSVSPTEDRMTENKSQQLIHITSKPRDMLNAWLLWDSQSLVRTRLKLSG